MVLRGGLDVLSVIGRGLDLAQMRHRAIGNNIANASTPNYKRREVTFDGQLARARTSLQGLATDPHHLPLGPSRGVSDGRPVMVRDRFSSARNDGNNVDIDREMAELAKNSIYYESLGRAATHQLARLRTVLRSEG